MSSLRHFPLGSTYPESPHAVASSLPTMASVCAYEERDAATLTALRSGYPRFVVHEYVRKLWHFYQKRHAWDDQHGVLVPSRRAARDLLDWIGGGGAVMTEVDRDLFAVHCPAEASDLFARIAKYVQHVGCGISSRQAEDLLLEHRVIEAVHEERGFLGSAEDFVERELASVIGCRKADVLLCACGMSAFFAGFQAIREFQRSRGRRCWVQIGWLYLDSGCILKQFLEDGEVLETVFDATDTEAVLALLDRVGGDLACVVVECPSNPLAQVADLNAVAAKARALGGLMLVDPTIASIYNVDLLAQSDILVTSLTKYAAHEGDVMIGALAINPDGPHYGDLVLRTSRFHLPPYRRDLARVAAQMDRAAAVVETINRNAARLSEWLSGRPEVRRVHYAGAQAGYERFLRPGGGGGSIITVELTVPMERFYDAAELLKGPSFGTVFTFLCPFMYLAHYDLVTTESGRSHLREAGIDPELIRISVGTEPFEAIRDVFQAALSQAAEV